MKTPSLPVLVLEHSLEAYCPAPGYCVERLDDHLAFRP